MGEGCTRLWQAFSEGKERHSPSELRGRGGTRSHSQRRTRVPMPSARGQSRGLDPCSPMCPRRISLFHHLSPSREHKGAGEVSFIYRKGKTRFSDVKEKHEELPTGGELTPATNFSRPGVDFSATPSLYIKAGRLPTRGALIQPQVAVAAGWHLMGCVMREVRREEHNSPFWL